jgi:gas vesicle protein
MQDAPRSVCAVVNTPFVRRPRKVLAQGYPTMTEQIQKGRDYGFAIGLMAGTLVGAVLAMWLAPKAAAELRDRVTDSAKALGKRASEQYRQAGSRAGEAVDQLKEKGQGVRDDVADVIARGAHEVERYAVASKSRGTA